MPRRARESRLQIAPDLPRHVHHAIYGGIICYMYGARLATSIKGYGFNNLLIIICWICMNYSDPLVMNPHARAGPLVFI